MPQLGHTATVGEGHVRLEGVVLDTTATIERDLQVALKGCEPQQITNNAKTQTKLEISQCHTTKRHKI